VAPRQRTRSSFWCRADELVVVVVLAVAALLGGQLTRVATNLEECSDTRAFGLTWIISWLG